MEMQYLLESYREACRRLGLYEVHIVCILSPQNS